MANGGMPPDMLEALADFEELARLRAERRRAGKVLEHELGASDSQLVAAFERIRRYVGEGLTLTASAALAGVTKRTLAAWVKLGDERRQPWAGWLDGVMQSAAEQRRQVLSDLRKLAAVDGRAFRDLVNQTGRPSPLEYEVEGLRKVKSATFDVLTMPADTQRNDPAKAEGHDPENLQPGKEPAQPTGNQ